MPTSRIIEEIVDDLTRPVPPGAPGDLHWRKVEGNWISRIDAEAARITKYNALVDRVDAQAVQLIEARSAALIAKERTSILAVFGLGIVAVLLVGLWALERKVRSLTRTARKPRAGAS